MSPAATQRLPMVTPSTSVQLKTKLFSPIDTFASTEHPITHADGETEVDAIALNWVRKMRPEDAFERWSSTSLDVPK